jgi:hypothetical protein
LVARWKVDLFLFRPRRRPVSIVEDTTQRRTPCPGNQEWRRLCRRISRWPLSLLFEVLNPGYMEDAIERRRGNPALDQPAGDDWFNWAVGPNGIYFLDSSSRTNATVKCFDFATGTKISISTSDKPPGVGLALSPDSRSIFYVQNESAESSIMLVKNFR